MNDATPDDCHDAGLPRINPIVYLAGGLFALILIAIVLAVRLA